MAIAVTQGHAQRALDFYKKEGKYFIIGGTTPWEEESSPPNPSLSDYKLNDVVGLKRVDNCHLVIPDNNRGTISYRTQNWRIVVPPFKTTISGTGVTSGSNIVPVSSLENLEVGNKVRVNSLYEGIITDKSSNGAGNTITLDTPAPVSILPGATLEGGAIVEGAKYVYVDCYLSYGQFPIATYRQIGLCTEVLPNNIDVLRSAGYEVTTNEYTSLGVLEIIDNRSPSTRNIDQRELLSLIIEF